MSKLADKLKLVSEAGAPPMGFKSAAQTKHAPLLLIGEFTLPLEVREVGLALDAIVVKVTSLSKEMEDIKKLKASVPDNVPLGLALKNVTEKALVQLKEASPDFIVFRASEATAASIADEESGKVVAVDPSWTDSSLRSLDVLPVDAVLSEDMADKTSLTVQSLIDLRRVSLLTSKPLLVRLSYLPTEKELPALLRVLSRGLVIGIKSGEDLSEMPKLRALIENLPRTKPKKPSMTPLVPQLSRAESEPVEEEEEDE